MDDGRTTAAVDLAIVYGIDDEKVLKDYYAHSGDLERRVFERLGSHLNIVRYFGSIAHASTQGLGYDK